MNLIQIIDTFKAEQDCRKSCSVAVGTIFCQAHIEFQKWFWLIDLIMNVKKIIRLPSLLWLENSLHNNLVNDMQNPQVFKARYRFVYERILISGKNLLNLLSF